MNPGGRWYASLQSRAWPLWLVTAGTPLLFFLGLQGLAWSLPCVVFGIHIVAKKDTRYPRSAAILLLFSIWVFLSIVQVPAHSWAVFMYRWSIFTGVLTCLVWVANQSEEDLPTDKILAWFAAMWIAMIALGYVAIALPHVSTPSPFQMLTGPVGRIDFVARMSRWQFADYQGGQGVSLPRPAAPFPAANGWGAAIGILTPFFIYSWVVNASRRRRHVGFFLLVAAIPPVMASGNRGLWISVSVTLLYWSVRRATQRDLRPLGMLLGGAVVVGLFFLFTPAGTLVTNRLDTAQHSTDARASIYEAAWQGGLQSPFLGHGNPGSVTDTTLPPIGTHGMVWYLMYVHGFVGLGLFMAWLLWELVYTGRRIRGPSDWWIHLSLVAAMVQMPFYGMMPHVVIVGATAGLAHRARTHNDDDAEPAEMPSS
ncbi:MAG TPA: O-antigen ligase family protein, partial [Acidimicrobiales bacterium]